MNETQSGEVVSSQEPDTQRLQQPGRSQPGSTALSALIDETTFASTQRDDRSEHDPSPSDQNMRADNAFDGRINALYECAAGHHHCLWYKFRRFEHLSLFNLYDLQDRIIQFENEVEAHYIRGDSLSRNDISKQNDLLKEYHEALIRFKEISQMKRPLKKQRDEVIEKLVSVVGVEYGFSSDPGMVDMKPATQGKELDFIRLFINRTFGFANLTLTEQRPTTFRPYQIISEQADSFARIVIAVISALFLVAPMITLSYVNVKWARLLTASLFILLFCITTSAAPQAKNHEVIMMTAAYAAVIVVFVGQTS
ncbi:hypothetical protein G7054_g12159 [Neopestalotiopsis clavispora]|nr:hypothetical protein G7054_g12159 [Neopestalotiopsis clavispora]